MQPFETRVLAGLVGLHFMQLQDRLSCSYYLSICKIKVSLAHCLWSVNMHCSWRTVIVHVKKHTCGRTCPPMVLSHSVEGLRGRACGTQGEIFAAEGYGKVTGEVGVCIATSGPGATNLVTGLADALLDSVPMVAITGQVGSSPNSSSSLF